jgi:Ca2+-binding RTX toxin-like protein
MTFKIWGTEDVVRVSSIAVERGSVSMSANGGYVVTFAEGGKLYFQRYNGNGDKVGGPTDIGASSIVSASYADVQNVGTDGSFAVAWTEEINGQKTLLTRKYNADGSPTTNFASLVATGPNVGHGAKVSADHSGGWIVTYSDIGTPPDTTTRVKVTAYDAAGAVLGTKIDIAAGLMPEAVYLGDVNGVARYAVLYQKSASPAKFEVKLFKGATLVATQEIDATKADVVALKNQDGSLSGAFAVVAENGAAGVTAHTYRADGSANGTPVAIGGAKQDSGPDYASSTALRDGGFAVLYAEAALNPDGGGDFGDIFIRVVRADGTVNQPLRVNAHWVDDSIGGQSMPSISEMADGRLALTWYDSAGSLNSGAISTTIVDARIGKIKVTGTAGDDIYAPSEYGIGDPEGGDDLDGGDGIDTLTFKGTTTGGVAVNLATQSGSAGDAAGDIYKNFENIIGSNFADTLVGSAVSNTINGGAGNDVIDGLGSVDEMNGGTGADIYYVDDTADRINESAAADIDTVYTSATYTLSAYIENLFATGTGAINLTGNDLNNTIVGNEAANGINGGNGNDVLHGAGGNDVINAGAGNDVLEGGTGADILSGGDGIDALNGGDDNDTLSGGEGADNLNGGNGNDSLDGGNGDDVMQGGGGADVMNGGAGNDTYYIDDVNDQVVDGAGVDTVYLGVSYDVSRLGTIENITGIGAVDITLTGNAFNNVLTGNDGANNLIGGAGNDVLYGGAGNDRIHGQEGNDILAGGGGRDLFVFDKRPHKTQNVDRIVDYNVRDDSIYLENKYFKVTPAGSLSNPKQMASKYFYKGAKAHDRDDRIIYDQKKGILYYDSDGTGSSAAVKIATLDKKLGMTAKDFFVI